MSAFNSPTQLHNHLTLPLQPIPGTDEHISLVQSMHDVIQTRFNVGPNKAFQKTRKVLKQACRAIPRGFIFAMAGIAQQLFRLLFIKLGLGIWIERLVARTRGVPWNEQQHSTLNYLLNCSRFAYLCLHLF